jgi:AraC family transcriptional activator of pobA
MKEKAKIPIHDFAADNDDSVPFRYVPLGALTSYDFSAPHRHNYYEIFFFAKGGGDHLIDFRSYPVSDNSIHFVSPGQVHMIRRAADSHGSIVLFSRDFFHTVNDVPLTLFNFPFLNNSLQPVLPIAIDEYAGFAPILTEIQKECGNTTEVGKEILRTCIKMILLKCLQLFDQKHPDHRLKQGSLFHTFRHMVEQQYKAQRQPGWYAGQLNITEKKLNAVCKDSTGENVGDYIKNRIVLEAKRLLVNTDYTIKEIAYYLGFDDPAYFNRFFKGNTGDTAGSFRKSNN